METRRPAGPLMSLEEYLAFEERSPVRHEYVAGETYAMAGATTRHNLITLNVSRLLYGPARVHGCRVFAMDVKLRVEDRVYYPDVIVACGRAADVESIVEEPSLVVEVTSPATRATDRREKLESYKRIPSLQGYLIVDQRRPHVLAYGRAADGQWLREEIDGEGGKALSALNQRIALNDIYDGVDLPPLAVREEEDWEGYPADNLP